MITHVPSLSEIMDSFCVGADRVIWWIHLCFGWLWGYVPNLPSVHMVLDDYDKRFMMVFKCWFCLLLFYYERNPFLTQVVVLLIYIYLPLKIY